MHEHDLDLIAAFAEGSLDDATVARDLVESCDVCRSEYEGQMAVLRLLGATRPAAMTDIERAALHRNLWTQLSRTPEKATPWWYRLSYAAAGILVVVGLFGALNGWLDVGGVETAASFSEIGSGMDQPTDDGGALPLSGGDVDQQARSTTTMAAAEESASYPFADLAEEARVRRTSTGFQPMVADEGERACLTTLGLEDQQIIDRLELDQAYLVLMPPDDPGSATVTFVASASCEITHIEG
jgi:hypothetical protein